MSHFNVVVLVPGTTALDKIEKVVGELMAPYDESLEVESYRVYLKEDKRYFSKSLYHKVQEWRESAQPGDTCPYDWDLNEYGVVAENYGVSATDLPAIASKMNAWHGEEGHVDAELGKVYTFSTYNPQSKWDYWVIGGRFDGRMVNDLNREGDGYGDPERVNVCRVSELPPPELVTVEYRLFDETPLPPEQHYYRCPYALVTPDGEWHAKGRMGWFGMSDDKHEPVEWSKRYFEILSGHRDCIAVNLDCHI